MGACPAVGGAKRSHIVVAAMNASRYSFIVSQRQLMIMLQKQVDDSSAHAAGTDCCADDCREMQASQNYT